MPLVKKKIFAGPYCRGSYSCQSTHCYFQVTVHLSCTQTISDSTGQLALMVKLTRVCLHAHISCDLTDRRDHPLSLSLSLSLSVSALCYLSERGQHVQHSSLLHGACVVQVFLLQVDLHPVLFGQSGVLHTGEKKRSSV